MKKLDGFNLVLLAVIISLCSVFTGRASAAGVDRPLPALASGKISALNEKVKTTAPTEAQKADIKNTYGKLPLYFIKNNGQVDGKVSFYERGAGHATFFTSDGVVLSLTKKDGKSEKPSFKKDILGLETEKPDKSTSEAVSLSFVGANSKAKITADDKMSGKVNYFVGNEKSKWRSNIPTYGVVTYEDVYKNIDVKFYGNNKNIEHDVIVRPGGNPSLVKFAYDGVKGLKVTENGDLEVSLNSGKLIEQKPVIYQDIKGERVAVDGTYRILKSVDGAFIYGFNVASYDHTKDLVIDPVLVYSTYLGGRGTDSGSAIAVDATGAIYVTGGTASTDFPTVNPIQGIYGGGTNGGDVFVTKINPAGTAIVYSTYLGGSGDDGGNGIAVDSTGAVYVTGHTASTDFPLRNAIQGVNGGYEDIFITKINPTGSAILYSTYIGGSSYDYGDDIAVDNTGATYVIASTSSQDLPIVNPIQPAHGGGGRDAFIIKINPAGRSIVYSTYLGGTGYDGDSGIAVDSTGAAYVTGWTDSTDFPLVNSIQTSLAGATDAYITKIAPAGSTIIYSTFIGGLLFDFGEGIAIDSIGAVYVTGHTWSTDFPLVNPIQGVYGGGLYEGDAFITKINPAGIAIVYSTYLGGSGDDIAFNIAVDSAGAAYVSGNTGSTDFPVVAPIQGICGDLLCSDVFVTKINPAGSALVYSTYLGGNNLDYGFDIVVDSFGAAYVTGQTCSTDFPLMNPIQGFLGGGVCVAFMGDAFITKISGGTPPPAVVTLAVTPDAVSIARGGTLGYNVTATNTTTTQQCFSYWENVTLPNGSTYPTTGALFGPVNLCLNANASKTAHLTHGVPMSAPVGAYAFNAFVGTYPTPVTSENHFNFDVTALGPLTNQPATSWRVIENGFRK